VDLHAGTLRIKQQVQFINGKIVFTQLKTDRSRRTLVLTQETLETLKEHLVIVNGMKSGNPYGWLENNLIFPNIDGSPRASTNDYNEWKRALRLCGIAKRRLHDARHTAATLMYSQGVGIETISRALGHSSSAITSKLYVHSALEPLENAARLLDQILR
jgi:integrase